MDIKLYYTPKTRALRPRWLLEELGLAYELIHIDLFGGETRTDEFRKINPNACIPAMEVDGQVMFESGALCAWLSDQHQDKGLSPPLSSPQRMAYDQWMYYVPGTLEPPVWNYLLHRLLLPKEQRVPEILAWSLERYRQSLAVVSENLNDKTYMLGEQFTTADIMVGTTLMWQCKALKDYPVLQNYTERLKQRAAYQKAIS